MTVEEYLEQFPADIGRILKQIRSLIKKLSAEAEESIGYGMPAYKLKGKPLVYFAAFKKHVGLYPTPSGIKEFEKELANYKSAKGSVQFPLDKPIPYDLIEKIIRFRVNENVGL
ncbi:DUF1801 domain-containing protein [Candidatus Shapirobacteria bacterium]|nr:DUF1801 domain-containing protein [Candidatus Shapirobacteria bacterium]